MRKVPMRKVYLWLLLLLSTSQCFALVNTHLESSQVSQGQSFRISYSYDGQATGVVPDLSPLEKNFDILGTSKSSQVSIINGAVNTSTQWTVTLIAKTGGDLTVPAIKFGNELSQSVKIQVVGSQLAKKQSLSKEAFLTTEVNSTSPYVQSQVNYTVKLYYANSLTQADFQKPQAANVMMMQLGNAKSYQEQKSGKLYQVIEQKYALFPQQSGEVTIKSPVFNGAIRRIDLNRIDDILNNYQQPLQLRGNDITLQVKPAASDFTGSDWFPAKNVTLTQQWQDLKDSSKAGVPITRTITLSATGLTAEQIPTLTFSDKEGLGIYPEKPELKNTLEGNDVEGHKTIKIVYIPSKNGKITIPATRIAWFDTNSNKQQVAMLPAQTITVFGAKESAPQATPPTTQKVSKKPQPIASKQASSTNNGHAWFLTSLFAIAWIATLLFWFFSRKKPGTANAKTSPSSIRPIKKVLKKACMANDARATRDALLQWAQNKWPTHKIHNIAAIAEMLNDEDFRKQLGLLQIELYANKAGNWQGDKLWQTWLCVKVDEEKAKKENPLPSIN